jgi:membrane-bound serine protease (ClpP class)
MTYANRSRHPERFARPASACALATLFLVALFLSLVVATSAAAFDSTAPVLLLEVNGAIDPINAQYVVNGLDAASRVGAQAVLIEMDTPGGLDSSMRQITGAMIASPVPVIVYVTPNGARAGSAGVFIMMAADVGAMAPGTNIGAAHPVDLGSGGATNVPADETVKVTNDAAAYARTLATARHHDAVWAEESVRQSVALSANEALSQGVIDLVSADRTTLLANLDGRSIVRGANTLILHPKSAEIRPFDMTVPEQLLHLVDDPNIAYLLVTIGFWAILAELFHPGTLVPGVVGVLALALGLTATQSLPLNWTGLALIVGAIGLFVLDLKAPTHGALTLAGLVTFIVGSLMLYAPTPGIVVPGLDNVFEVGVSPALIAVIGIGLAAFFLFTVRASLRARHRPAWELYPAAVGAIGVANTDLAPKGSVHVGGGDWTASTNESPITKGDKVVVVSRTGLHLLVRRANKS